jgi:hypothetical protein
MGETPMKRLGAVLLLLLCSLPAHAGSSRPYGKGGWFVEFQPVIDRYNATGELMRIEGHCQSLCTIFLGLPNVCVERSARLLFHAGHDRQRRFHAASTERKLAAYSPSLRQYLVSGGHMTTHQFHTVSGAAMIDRFGYKECPRR